MASPVETAAMRRAITLADRGLGRTSPNPVVGCVVLDDTGAVVGEGHHARAGGPHAEVVALAAAGPAARGGTAVVTLEPCAHSGRTGPCTEALRTAGVARVVAAVPDPDPAAAGGAATLRAAGVQVEMGTLAAEAAAGNRAWLTAVRRRRPHVTWKFAASLDGRSAAADGSSRWITGAAARADVHLLRDRVDAVVVGAGTALADDPQLTVRDPVTGQPAARQPLRVVVDSTGRTPATARVHDGTARTWVATVAELGAGPDGRVDLDALAAALFGQGVRSVLLEGGPTLAGACWRRGLVDEVVGYLAPALLGAGPAAVTDVGVATIAGARRLVDPAYELLGPDLKVTARTRTEED